ncbi:hypothetical protein QQF64_027264 [Cirrhinus molitorella]|uniref:Uncharacterized protein n=1 Tax=Cirrhinus molitorella TaxID=172907 RepID=A0ABR3NCN1_9TELE
MEDNMAITIKRFEDILKTELAAMRSEFSSHMTTVQNMCSKVDLIGEQREQKKVINKHTGRLDALEQQVIDLQDCSRRSKFTPELQLITPSRECFSSNCYVTTTGRPHSPVKANDGAMLSFFPNFSPATAKKWSSFSIIRKELKEAGLQTFLQYPATLKIVMKHSKTKALTGRSASIPEFHTRYSFS